MPISEEIQRIILRDGSALDIAGAGTPRRRTQPARIGLHKVKMGLTSLEECWPSPTNKHTGECTMATAASRGIKDFLFRVGRQGPHRQDRAGEIRRGRKPGVQATLRRQGVLPTRSKAPPALGKKIKPKDIAPLFTRQMATMMKAGVPLLQAFDIVGAATPIPASTKLLNDIRATWKPAPR